MRTGMTLFAGSMLAATATPATSVPICTTASTVAAAPGLAVKDPWTQPVLPGLPTNAYFTLTNKTDRDAILTSASSPACSMLSLDQAKHHNDGMTIKSSDAFRVPAHGSLSFRPGGYHLMCAQPIAQLEAGATIIVTLIFQDGQHLSRLFPVRDGKGL